MPKAAEIAISIIGLVMFAVGYFRNSRNLMLVGGIIILIGIGGNDFMRGFNDAFIEGIRQHAP